ncbi:bifunctional adenosylcobinamide kinase/adenosylcobinamide-phosphate guanylyltransferase [Halomonas sp. SL1]|uniref:bifunctional adenosylcobinamide kinase/adenosylcobinamide-phosphate guanylyltransferase n=1 Tax=Halomonas sp. SL1 TaxID=2137478 RepID=UPI000D167517|nr:bifunctional adenosylcobinamide kinase/adenosylcobinamide-phosphate guanylyltransferase [Halomonas sp. SL1]RAH38860.1 adenosylcobinamide kinase [Halomonas sp. SL1]
MQLFIGGACAGKRDLVAARFPDAGWARIDELGLDGREHDLRPGAVRVLTGWTRWLENALATEPDDDRLRARLVASLDALKEAEREARGEIVLILPEMGRGIVPMDAADRRLRDLAGWLAQDAAARAESVWYVRHGLARRL